MTTAVQTSKPWAKADPSSDVYRTERHPLDPLFSPRSVAVIGRIQTELEELKRCQPATSLWKLRADALVVLLDVARSAYDSGTHVITNAQKAGEPAVAEAVQTSMQKLRERAEFVVKTLAG